MFSVFGLKTSAEPFVSEEELKLVLAGATKSGEVESSEKEMIQNVLDLEDVVVRDVMTPLVQVYGVRSSSTLEEFQKEWIEHKYSRVPAWDDRVDNIVGIVRANRVMQLDIEHQADPSANKPLEDILVSDVMITDTYFVPESMSVGKLLRELMARKSHMCVVVNEFGGTVGIATLEDCMEEIVGEIYDEDDVNKANANDDEVTETPFIREVEPNVYVVDTRAALWKLSDELSLDIPESPLYETVGGWVCDLFGCIPSQGSQLCQSFDVVMDYDAESEDEDKNGETDGLEFDSLTKRSISLSVTDSDSRRVNEIRIEVMTRCMTECTQEEGERDEEHVLSPA
jgi:CBS domain containing-hemolysin-like protein